MENDQEQLPAPLLHGYINEGDKSIFENTRARAWNLRQTSFIRRYQYLLIIIVIPSSYYVDTHIDICCESKRVNSAHLRLSILIITTSSLFFLIQYL